ncbi:DUF3558 domain-containing protein [Dietzia cinnamea]|uniref:DUF3558 domain-containing protein n=1 Tax=Dietzia cinnamea TaxID=321318 RepID=UPI0021A4004A|nr:DUF3558 domain-containing protein [Dietzia cinnamea]MCT2273877.1 DUF3558 domain-containing protein [Dietzia cinnamea]
MCGALVAALVVLSGCASADGEEETPPTTTTTSAAAPEDSGNPWDLPVAQRPALFDPCAEIPVEAIEDGVGSPLREAEGLRNHEPGDLFTCGWKNDEILLGVISTWKAKGALIGDRGFGSVDTESTVSGRPGFRASDVAREDDTCYQAFFTSRGAVLVNLNLRTSLRTFRGERPWRACDVLDEVIEPVMPYIPGGDY